MFFIIKVLDHISRITDNTMVLTKDAHMHTEVLKNFGRKKKKRKSNKAIRINVTTTTIANENNHKIRRKERIFNRKEKKKG